MAFIPEIMYNLNVNRSDCLEESLYLVKHIGFCLIEDVLLPSVCRDGIDALRYSYKQILSRIGLERLSQAGEEGVIRAPMSFHPFFYNLLENPLIQEISECFLEKTSILHLQNGFIFPQHFQEKELTNFQYQFHTDYPRYHNGYLASINAMVTFTDFEAADEVFFVVPGTHQSGHKLSQSYCERNKLSLSAPAGSILIFDSTCWHCGGPNKTEGSWYGVNHQFTRSFIKQQIDYVRLLGDSRILSLNTRVQQMLGYYTRVVTCLDEYYQPNEKRLYRSGQG